MRYSLVKGQVYPHKAQCQCFRCTGKTWNKGIKGSTGITPWKGKKRTPETIQKMSVNRKGKYAEQAHYRWKGDAVGYTGLHEWVVQRLGKPTTCEHCGKTGLVGRKIQWANKSWQYKRDITDWMRLCVACHRRYDAQIDRGITRQLFIVKNSQTAERRVLV